MNNTPKPGSRAVIYTRVSQDRDGEGMAVSRQEEQCRALANLRGWEVVAHEEDNSISASTGKHRPGWERVLEHIESGSVDVVVAWHLDRLTRSMLDLERLIVLSEESGVAIATVSGDYDLSGDVGRMVARILAAVARGEVDRKAARQKAANKQRAEQGKWWRGGWRPFGYDAETGAVVEPEAQAIRDAGRDVLAGVSLKDIVRRWTAEGLTPTSGRDGGWHVQTVKNILTNELYAGLRYYDGKTYEGEWEPILSPAEHYELRAFLTDPKRRVGGNPGGRHPINLLTGYAVCGKAGHPLRAGTSNGRPVYTCAKGCLVVDREGMDDTALNALAMTIATMRPGAVIPAQTRANASELEAERESILGRLDALAESLGKGALSEREWEVARRAPAERLAEIEALLSDAPSLPMTEIVKQSRKRFADMDLADRRRMLDDLSTEIAVLPVGRGRRNVNLFEHVLMSITTLDGSRSRMTVLGAHHKKAEDALAHLDEIRSMAE